MKKVTWEHLTGTHITDAILDLMAEMLGDFTQVRDGYLAAIEKLSETQGELCKAEMAAIDSQLRSLVLFSGMLGLKANWEYFTDPLRDFLDVDTEVYLREETAHKLPQYKAARQTREAFFARLSEEEREIYDGVLEYACYLETVAPKLAHYYGYMLGNLLLPQIMPGYHPSALQTAAYEATLNRYFSIS